jgi:hypothetical protein
MLSMPSRSPSTESKSNAKLLAATINTLSDLMMWQLRHAALATRERGSARGCVRKRPTAGDLIFERTFENDRQSETSTAGPQTEAPVISAAGNGTARAHGQQCLPTKSQKEACLGRKTRWRAACHHRA